CIYQLTNSWASRAALPARPSRWWPDAFPGFALPFSSGSKDRTTFGQPLWKNEHLLLQTELRLSDHLESSHLTLKAARGNPMDIKAKEMNDDCCRYLIRDRPGQVCRQFE